MGYFTEVEVDGLAEIVFMEGDDPSNQPDKEELYKRAYKTWHRVGKALYGVKECISEDVAPAGVYTIEYDRDQNNYFLFPKEIKTDDLIETDDDLTHKMKKELDLFWTKADAFKKAGVIHKRGVLMHGRGGMSKSSTIQLLCKKVITSGGIVIYIENHDQLYRYTQFMNPVFRVIQPETPVVIVIEDIHEIVRVIGQKDVLSVLDGENQVEHCVVLATTNYLSELSDVMTRPSRFDHVMEINSVPKKLRTEYLKRKGLPEEDLAKWLKDSSDMSLAELKELFIGVKLLDNDYNEVLTKLREQANLKVNKASPVINKVGF